MQYHHIGYRVRGFYRLANLGHGENMNHDAQHRLNILRFWEQHGLAAAGDAFQVSRRTLKQAQDNPAALSPASRAPKRRRQPTWSPQLVPEIRRLRELHPNLGKQPLWVLLKPWCAQHGVPQPSVSTIGRIDAPLSHPARCPWPTQACAPSAENTPPPWNCLPAIL